MKQSSIDHIKRMQKAHDILIKISGDMEELTFLSYDVGFDENRVIEAFNGDIELLKSELIRLTKLTYDDEQET